MFATLHKNNIIHGDLTTSNLLVQDPSTSDPELIVIDFGLGFAEGTPEDKGVDLYVLERAFLSTHPNTEPLVKIILDAYAKEFKGETLKGAYDKKKKACDEILAKYEEIRMRGRKRTMVG